MLQHDRRYVPLLQRLSKHCRLLPILEPPTETCSESCPSSGCACAARAQQFCPGQPCTCISYFLGEVSGTNKDKESDAGTAIGARVSPGFFSGKTLLFPMALCA